MNINELMNDRYVIGLPWRKDKTLLPDDRSLSETGLRSLEEFEQEPRESENVR